MLKCLARQYRLLGQKRWPHIVIKYLAFTAAAIGCLLIGNSIGNNELGVGMMLATWGVPKLMRITMREVASPA